MIVTLTTDFGLTDGYVAALKGAVLSRAPGATLVDVSHAVPQQDVMAAAFALRQAIAPFPEGTVHLAVVDPGTGTDRLPLAVRFLHRGAPHYFVGPDNGLLPLVLDSGTRSDVPAWRSEAVVLDARAADAEAARPSARTSSCDLFGPVAGLLAAGAALADLGAPAPPLQRLSWPLPRTDHEGIDGMVLAVDHSGNCLTNISRETVEAFGQGRRSKCYAGSVILPGLSHTYSDVPVGEPLALFGTDGALEIAVRNGHASSLLSLHRGDAVNIVFEPVPRPAALHARSQPA